MSSRLGIDVGGAFTDLLLFDDSSGRFYTAKIPLTSPDPLTAMLTGIRHLLEQSAMTPSRLGSICHASSHFDNIIVQHRGAKVGLLVSEHCEQVLYLPPLQNLSPMPAWMTLHKPDPPADLACTRGIGERIGAGGEILKPLDENQARTAIRQLLAAGVETIGVALLHAYANPVHERRLRALIAELDAAMPVWLSADLLPQSGEYERTLVTVLNAALASAVRDYYAELAERLSTDGFTANIYSARSDGALMNLRQAGETPVYTLLSGPAGAVAGAGFTTALAGYPDAIAFDMGGSATRIGLIRDGKPLISRRTALGPLPLAIAAVAIHPVAAGAATSAYIADGDVLQLGAPEPSGGTAGERASIAAANLVLGRLPAQLPGVDRTAQLQAATDAVARIAAVLAMEDSYQVAQGIIDMFNENLYGALREMAVQQAIDPHQFALVAGGGAGPLHANALAALAGCYPVIIPPTPGVLAALGLLCATLRQEFSCVFIGALDAIEPGRLGDRLNALGLDAEAWLTAAGVAASEQHIDYEVDARYRRQDREITLPVTADFADRGAMLELRERFTTEHYRRHGFDSDAAVELVNLRAIGSAVDTGLKLPKQQQADSDASAARIAQQRVYFDGALVNMDIYQREQLAAGNRIRGPALIVQSDSTTLIHPQHTAAIDGYLNILIHPETLAGMQEQPVWR